MSDDFLNLDYGKVAETITRFLSSQVKLRKKNGIVVGLSGGIDSSVCVILACRALSSHNVIGLSMPEKHVTPQRIFRMFVPLQRGSKLFIRKSILSAGKSIC